MSIQIGGLVRIARDARDISQGKLAEAIGVAQTTLSQLELGGTQPVNPVFVRALNAMDYDVEIVVRARDGSLRMTRLIGGDK